MYESLRYNSSTTTWLGTPSVVDTAVAEVMRTLFSVAALCFLGRVSVETATRSTQQIHYNSLLLLVHNKTRYAYNICGSLCISRPSGKEPWRCVCIRWGHTPFCLRPMYTFFILFTSFYMIILDTGFLIFYVLLFLRLWNEVHIMHVYHNNNPPHASSVLLTHSLVVPKTFFATRTRRFQNDVAGRPYHTTRTNWLTWNKGDSSDRHGA